MPVVLQVLRCKGVQLPTLLVFAASPVQILTTSPLLAVASKQSCTELQREKEEVCTSSEEALRTLKERHKEELVQLEDRCAIHPPPLIPEPASHARSDVVFSLPAFILTQTMGE